MISIEQERQFESGTTTYLVTVPDKDLIETDLDPIDRAVLSEPCLDAADVLQNLQILAFRQRQQTQADKVQIVNREEKKDAKA